MLTLSDFLAVNHRRMAFSDFSFILKFFTMEVKAYTLSEKIYSCEKSHSPTPLSFIKIKPNVFLTNLIFPIFLKNLNTEGV